MSVRELESSFFSYYPKAGVGATFIPRAVYLLGEETGEKPSAHKRDQLKTTYISSKHQGLVRTQLVQVLTFCL